MCEKPSLDLLFVELVEVKIMNSAMELHLAIEMIKVDTPKSHRVDFSTESKFVITKTWHILVLHSTQSFMRGHPDYPQFHLRITPICKKPKQQPGVKLALNL